MASSSPGARPKSSTWHESKRRQHSKKTQVSPDESRPPSQEVVQNTVNTWKDYIKEWYPMLLERAHFVPDVHMNRVLHLPQDVSEVTVGVVQDPQPQTVKKQNDVLQMSDVRDDRAQQHVLHCLRAIADGKLPGQKPQVMFVLSQLRFQDYLNKRCYAGAVKWFPRPADLKDLDIERGDFDVLIIHPEHGLLVGEIKSVGSNAAERQATEETLVTDIQWAFRKMLKLTDSLQSACFPRNNQNQQRKLGQVQKARMMLEHLTRDLEQHPRVKATLILPYISRQLLYRVLEDSELKEALAKDFGLPDGEDPVEFCLCSDQMSHSKTPWAFPPEILQKLGHWWQRCFRDGQPDQAMTDDTYVDVVARFAGPATAVSIYCRTEPRIQVQPTEMQTKGQAVSETHERLTQIALYPSQVEILQENRDKVVLKGPPGTGKTLMLVLKAVQWAREGQAVHILNTRDESLAATYYITQQVTETLKRIKKTDSNNVHVRLLTTGDQGDKEVKNLKQFATKMHQLCLIADEADGEVLSALYDCLKSPVNNLERIRLWAAGVKCAAFPDDLETVTLTDPLRCPPSVVRVLEETKSLQNGEVPPYTVPSAPPPTDGPQVKDIYHSNANGHDGVFTMECEKCGQEIADYLHNYLQVGKPVRRGSNGKGGSITAAIRFRDVLILTWDRDIISEGNNTRNRAQTSCKVVSALRKAGIPVGVVGEILQGKQKRRVLDQKGIKEVAEMKGPDEVVLTGVYNVWGLERKVVVWLGRGGGTVDHLRKRRDYDETGGRLYPVSRCTAQLILIRDRSSN